MRSNIDNNKEGKTTGAITSIVVHAAVIALLFVFSLNIAKPLEVDIPEKEFIAVELEQPRIKIPKSTADVTQGKKIGKPEEQAPPRTQVADKTRAPKANNKPETKAVTAGNDGDIERYEKPQPKVNEKALYQSTTEGTEEGNERSRVKDNSLFTGSGHSETPTRSPNAASGSTVSEKGVSFSLEGRSSVGGFPKPAYNLQKSGRVVVEITVDQNGKVTSARAIGKGSTLIDDTLWKAAEDAARRAKFNVDKKAAPLQQGTITYIFTLK